MLQVKAKMRVQVGFIVTFLMSCSFAQTQNNGIQVNNDSNVLSKVQSGVKDPNGTIDKIDSVITAPERPDPVIKNDENKRIKNSIIDIFRQKCKISEEALKPLELDACDFEETNTEIPLSPSCLAAKATAIKICTNSNHTSNNTIINSFVGGTSNITEFCSIKRNLNFSSDSTEVNEFFKLLRENTKCVLICSNLQGQTYPLCSFIVSHYQNQVKTVEPSPVDKPKKTVIPKIESPLAPANTIVNSSKVSKTPTNVSSSGKEPEANESNKLSSEGGTKDENVEEGDDNHSPSDTDDTLMNIRQDASAPEQDFETVKIARNMDNFVDSGNSNFFTYFLCLSGLCILFYVAMYNKKKILALVIEGRRTSVKRRPNSAAYSKLDCNLEEALLSGPSTSSSNTLLY